MDTPNQKSPFLQELEKAAAQIPQNDKDNLLRLYKSEQADKDRKLKRLEIQAAVKKKQDGRKVTNFPQKEREENPVLYVVSRNSQMQRQIHDEIKKLLSDYMWVQQKETEQYWREEGSSATPGKAFIIESDTSSICENYRKAIEVHSTGDNIFSILYGHPHSRRLREDQVYSNDLNNKSELKQLTENDVFISLNDRNTFTEAQAEMVANWINYVLNK